ncbi:MAG: right-handed parallel beta-helix repeat-containing protein [Candidatus Ratteibacteria bacterium]
MAPIQIVRWSNIVFANTGDVLGKGRFICDAEKERIEKGVVVSVNKQSFIEIKDNSNIKIEGITFDNSRKETIVVYNSSDIIIDNSIFRNLGAWAIKVKNLKNSKIQNCEVYNIRERGIYLEDRNRKTLGLGDNQVINNHIHNFSLWIGVYRPAIQINGVGIMLQII